MFELKKFYKIFINILIIIISFIIILTNYEKKNFNRINIREQKKFNFNLDKIYTNKILFFEKINDYIRICRKGILINDINYNNTITPKITAIIPVFNAFKTIKYAIRSIQNQNMSDIEIILVDDVSTDNSLEIIEELMLEDKRIKLIKNKENKGILYSRSIGALTAKGKYIMALDNDDLFIYGIFNKAYEDAEQNNIDILEFSGIQLCHNCLANMNKIYIPYYLRFKENGLIVKQPELSKFIYIKKNGLYSYDFNDVFVWGKLIKTEIYKKAVKLLGNFIYDYKIFLTEDKIFTVAIYKVANSFRFIDIYGIIYIENQYSVCHSWLKSKKQRILTDFLLFAIIYYEITKDSEEIQIIVEDLKIRYNEYNTVLEGKYEKLFIELYNNILKCKNILDSEKQILINLIIQSNKTNSQNKEI